MKLTYEQKEVIRRSFEFEYKNLISDFERELEEMVYALVSNLQDFRDKIKVNMINSFNQSMDEEEDSYDDSRLFPELFAELEKEDE